jgi:hypothetical protein
LSRILHLRFDRGGIDSFTGLSAPEYFPRDAIPAPQRNLISYPSQMRPLEQHFWQAGRASSHWILLFLQLQHPLKDRWRWEMSFCFSVGGMLLRNCWEGKQEQGYKYPGSSTIHSYILVRSLCYVHPRTVIGRTKISVREIMHSNLLWGVLPGLLASICFN